MDYGPVERQETQRPLISCWDFSSDVKPHALGLRPGQILNRDPYTVFQSSRFRWVEACLDRPAGLGPVLIVNPGFSLPTAACYLTSASAKLYGSKGAT